MPILPVLDITAAIRFSQNLLSTVGNTKACSVTRKAAVRKPCAAKEDKQHLIIYSNRLARDMKS